MTCGVVLLCQRRGVAAPIHDLPPVSHRPHSWRSWFVYPHEPRVVLEDEARVHLRFFEKYPTRRPSPRSPTRPNVLEAIKSLGLRRPLRSLVALTTFLRGAPLEPSRRSRRAPMSSRSRRTASPSTRCTASARSASVVGSCSARTRAPPSLSKGGEPLAPFVAWRKRAAKAEARSRPREDARDDADGQCTGAIARRRDGSSFRLALPAQHASR